ncbi:unnamed protein product [Lactuca virosa]|uniref:Uncharacterized protein n=1 Tax=Lactuca virosa TaxID=75947 RepID=A0AAU9LZN5_9ASTR|nr:unnamed protein product [Lactuca virosa]
MIVYISLSRHGLVEICDGLRTSIKYWKEDIFFVHASTFPGPMVYGASTNRVVGPSPELTLEEQSVVDRLSENFVKCTDTKEIMLGMAEISPHWNK